MLAQGIRPRRTGPRPRARPRWPRARSPGPGSPGSPRPRSPRPAASASARRAGRPRGRDTRRSPTGIRARRLAGSGRRYRARGNVGCDPAATAAASTASALGAGDLSAGPPVAVRGRVAAVPALALGHRGGRRCPGGGPAGLDRHGPWRPFSLPGRRAPGPIRPGRGARSAEPPTQADLEAVVAEISSFVEQEEASRSWSRWTWSCWARGVPGPPAADFDEDVDTLQQDEVLYTALGLVPPELDMVDAMRSLLGAGWSGSTTPRRRSWWCGGRGSLPTSARPSPTS